MLLFLFGLGILVVGYYTYGKFVEKVIAPDDRETPAVTHHDGVDFVKLPHWKNMLIQLLNIAGVGPVIGVIMGIKFGSVAFLIIPVGNIIGGAVHDFVSGMMSVRHKGANLPTLIKMTLGTTYYRIFAVFMTILLLLVVAVFINIPATLINGLMPALLKCFSAQNTPPETLINGLTPGVDMFWYAVIAIFLYYIVATLFPVDKIIGMIYPFFGGLLLVGTLAIFVALLWTGNSNPNLLIETAAFKAGMIKDPVIPVLFVTIACGIISGFHATQSPIIARTMESEHQGHPAFYGMMVLEGAIAMIWAAAGMAIYNLFPDMMHMKPGLVLNEITKYFLGSWMGVITVLGVIILAITSGDTAMRSLRLTLAEIFKIEQRSISKRVMICLPIIIVVCGLLWWSNMSAKSFGHLWNYFAWGNQVLAASTLFAATAWLIYHGKNWYITVIPAMFMTFIVATYILWVSPAHGGPVGGGLPLNVSYAIAAGLSVIIAVAVYLHGKRLKLD